MRLFLGVNGGQSSTVALIARDDGLVVGSGKSGPCNHVSANEAAARFTRVMSDCVNQACVSAAVDPLAVNFSAVCCGMSGGPEDKAQLIRNLLQTEHLRVVTDGEIALTGALSGKPGIIVISGTGSICFGRNTAGQLARAGGWGYIFGDEGSAFDIARRATRAALRFEEGWGPKTALHQILLDATNAPNANAMLHQFYSEAWPRARVAEMAALVNAAATGGDTVARAILDQAATSLATLAACVRRNVFDSNAAVRVSYVGGVFQSGFLLDRFQQLVNLSGCTCSPPDFSPAAGALIEAFQLCGLDVTPAGAC